MGYYTERLAKYHAKIDEIREEYVKATRQRWARHEEKLKKLWAKMEDGIEIPGMGMSVYSHKAYKLWIVFRRVAAPEVEAMNKQIKAENKQMKKDFDNHKEKE